MTGITNIFFSKERVKRAQALRKCLVLAENRISLKPMLLGKGREGGREGAWV